jgi:hypothetical protein
VLRRFSLPAKLGAGLSLVLLEWVMRDRAPPPWTERLLGFAVCGDLLDQIVCHVSRSWRRIQKTPLPGLSQLPGTGPELARGQC